MSIVDQLLRPHLRNVKPYSSARDEYTGKQGVFLDANENPFGSVAGDNWNRYPDPYQQDLKKVISSIKGVRQEQIFLGNGSDEPIDLLIRAFCEPGKDQVLTFPPTYGMYSVSAGIHNVGIKEIYLTNDFQLNMPEALAACADPSLKIAFVCSPNNPSGNAFAEKDILDIVRNFKGLVVVDEAYIDFISDRTLKNYIDIFPNLVLLQTFSKAWGLAAFRMGMAFASPEIIKVLNHIKAPYNISGPVQKAALSALMKFTQKDKWVNELITGRNWLVKELQGLEIVEKVYPSDANFLLVKFGDSAPVFSYLISQKVIVRDRSKVPLCENCLRLTVGTPEENQQLITTLQAFNY